MYIPSLTLRLKQRQDIVLAHGALDVADNAARRVVHELDTDLDDTTTRTSAAQHLGHLGGLVSVARIARYPSRWTAHALYVRAQA